MLEYVLGLSSERESAYAVAGSAAHEALAAYFQGHPAKAALALFQAIYEPFTEDPENFLEDRMLFDNCYAALEIWFARHPISKLPFVPEADKVEISIETPLDENGDFRYIAVLDVLAKARGEDSYVVVDHKSSKAINQWFDSKFVNGSQLTSYVWAARNYLNDDTINRAYINAIVFKKLNRTNTKCTMAGHGKRSDCWPQHVEYKILGPYERNIDQINDWHRTALRYAKKFPELYDKFTNKPLTQSMIDDLDVNGTLIDECRWCSMQAFCASGRKVHTLERRFVQRKRPELSDGRTGVFDDPD